jgi:hypothetical protein
MGTGVNTKRERGPVMKNLSRNKISEYAGGVTHPNYYSYICTNYRVGV